jgi:hypothetical protein
VYRVLVGKSEGRVPLGWPRLLSGEKYQNLSERNNVGENEDNSSGSELSAGTSVMLL